MKRKILLLLIIISATVFSQQEKKHNSFTVDLGAGYSRYLSDLDGNDLKRGGFSSLIRFNWHPGYLLSMSIESGFQQLYKYSSSISDERDGNVSVNVLLRSVPIFISFSMTPFPEKFPFLELSYGSGMFVLFSSLEDQNGSISNSLVSSGTLAGIKYIRPFGNLSLGIELKYMDLEKTNDSDLSLYAVVRYQIAHW